MGLFDGLLGKKERNFAKEFKDSVEKSYNTGQLFWDDQNEIITSWQKIPDCEDDANFWNANVIFISQTVILSGEKTSENLETLTKLVFLAVSKKPKDNSLAEWYKKNAKDAFDTFQNI